MVFSIATVSPVLSLVWYLFRLLFARLSLLIASGDEVLRNNDTLERTRWLLFDNTEADPIVSAIWCAPFDGLLAAHDRFAMLKHYPHDRFSLEAKSD